MTVRVDPISLSCVACFVERAQVLICDTTNKAVCPLNLPLPLCHARTT